MFSLQLVIQKVNKYLQNYNDNSKNIKVYSKHFILKRLKTMLKKYFLKR